MEKAMLVESRIIEGKYGFDQQQAIVDHPKHGRILITEQWGGGDVEGEQYRFKHGLAAKLHDNDTFETIDAPWNDCVTTIDAVLHGQDKSRPVFEWYGKALVSIAKSVGLPAC